MSKRKAEDDIQSVFSSIDDPAQKKLMFLPHRLINIVNSGDEVALRQFVAMNFSEDCLMKTPTMEVAVRGRQHIAASVESVFMSTPDLVLSVDNVRLVQENQSSSDDHDVNSGHRCLVFDLTFEGTSMLYFLPI